jgi:hypothetical protein
VILGVLLPEARTLAKLASNCYMNTIWHIILKTLACSYFVLQCYIYKKIYLAPWSLYSLLFPHVKYRCHSFPESNGVIVQVFLHLLHIVSNYSDLKNNAVCLYASIVKEAFKEQCCMPVCMSL